MYVEDLRDNLSSFISAARKIALDEGGPEVAICHLSTLVSVYLTSQRSTSIET